jgi:tetraacyldisaccharide 4'-kinase
LARAHAVILIGEGEPPETVAVARRPVLRASLDPFDAAMFRRLRVAAFAGIGRPDKFFASLRRVGAEIVMARAFPDHHRFSPAEITGLRREAERSGAQLVTTAKDWVRLPAAARVGIDVFEVELRWYDPATLSALLVPVLRPATDGAILGRKNLASRAAR